MAQVLEAGMLLCFGVSWPISLVKNIRAKTAKSTSIWFILLILLGYTAGIAAKLLSHAAGYVIVVYLFNFAVVFCNLIVWFFNHARDCREAKHTERRECHVVRAANL